MIYENEYMNVSPMIYTIYHFVCLNMKVSNKNFS